MYERDILFEAKGENAFDYRMHEGSAMRVSHHFGGATQLPVAIQTWVIPPGGFEGYHRHDHELPLTEFYQVLEGQARMRIADRKYVLGPGDSALAPAGIDHDLVNTGEGELRVLVVWGPPGEFDMSQFGSHRRSAELRSS
ncbi:cupin domain-containing protein [Glutamicibacter sp.]|uniref:cupin domain-containing protein n=1 Tax=Glutamicibacter sp. TaxID=1931995 RepID=UPI0028BDF923|nr:cupin domain-containing protein [Glutamicibacter sp.]